MNDTPTLETRVNGGNHAIEGVVLVDLTGRFIIGIWNIEVGGVFGREVGEGTHHAVWVTRVVRGRRLK